MKCLPGAYWAWAWSEYVNDTKKNLPGCSFYFFFFSLWLLNKHYLNHFGAKQTQDTTRTNTERLNHAAGQNVYISLHVVMVSKRWYFNKPQTIIKFWLFCFGFVQRNTCATLENWNARRPVQSAYICNCLLDLTRNSGNDSGATQTSDYIYFDFKNGIHSSDRHRVGARGTGGPGGRSFRDINCVCCATRFSPASCFSFRPFGSQLQQISN